MSPEGSARRRARPHPGRFSRFFVPRSVIDASDEIFREHRDEERECFLIWGGYPDGLGGATIASVIHPAVRSHYGRVALDRRTVHRVMECLRQRDQVLVAELHTHPPGAGGQNESDAGHTMSCHDGSIAVVVPDFGGPRFADLVGSFVYEYRTPQGWEGLGHAEVAERFLIDETLFRV